MNDARRRSLLRRLQCDPAASEILAGLMNEAASSALRIYFDEIHAQDLTDADAEDLAESIGLNRREEDLRLFP